MTMINLHGDEQWLHRVNGRLVTTVLPIYLLIYGCTRCAHMICIGDSRVRARRRFFCPTLHQEDETRTEYQLVIVLDKVIPDAHIPQPTEGVQIP